MAAYAGAMAAALCAMVARLTTGKPKYRDAWEAMDAVIETADSLAVELVRLMDADTDAYNGVVAAFKLSKDGGEEKNARSRAIQDATRRAAEVPLATLKAAAATAPLVEQVVALGNPNCITDAGTAVHLLQTAAMSAAYNVRINLASIKDIEFADECRRQVDELTSAVVSRAALLSEQVDARLG